jgi:hypothetical protein
MAILVWFLYDAWPLLASSFKRVAKAPSSTSIYPLFCLYRLLFSTYTLQTTNYKSHGLKMQHTPTQTAALVATFNFIFLVKLHSSSVHMWSISWRHVQCNPLVSPLKCPNVT